MCTENMTRSRWRVKHFTIYDHRSFFVSERAGPAFTSASAPSPKLSPSPLPGTIWTGLCHFGLQSRNSLVFNVLHTSNPIAMQLEGHAKWFAML